MGKRTKKQEQGDRFFLDRDNSAHWYIVPAANRTEWEEWLDLDEDDVRAWNEPAFARRIDGPSDVTFTDPKLERSEA